LKIDLTTGVRQGEPVERVEQAALGGFEPGPLLAMAGNREVGDRLGQAAGQAKPVVVGRRRVTGLDCKRRLGREQAIADVLDRVVATLAHSLLAISVTAAVELIAQQFERRQAMAVFAPTDFGLADHAPRVLEEQPIAAGTTVSLHGRECPVKNNRAAAMQTACRGENSADLRRSGGSRASRRR
jgi:hypothetical protein